MQKMKQKTLSLKNNNLKFQEEYIYMPDFKFGKDLTEPYYSRYYCISLLREGQLTLRSKLTDYSLESPGIIFAELSAIEKWEIPNEPYKLESILISNIFLQEKLIGNNTIQVLWDVLDTGIFISYLPECALHQMESMFGIVMRYTPPVTDFHREIVRGIIYAMTNVIGDNYTWRSSDTKILSKFSLKLRKAISEYAFSERNIQFYADLLHVHPKYLSQVIYTETGITIGRWIQIQVVLEAKILLQNDNITIGEVADLLCFPDQSTFSKYFKKYSGTSPSEYRRTIQKL